MENVDEYFITLVYSFCDVNYLNNSHYTYRLKPEQYVCVKSRGHFNEYMDLLKDDKYRVVEYYQRPKGMVIRENGKKLYLNQIIDKRKLTKNKLIKKVRPILLKLNSGYQLEQLKELITEIEQKQQKPKAKIIKFNK